MTAATPSNPACLPTVLLAGATGLVGQQLLRLLAQDEGVHHVRALVRRATPLSKLLPAPICARLAPDKVSLPVVDFDRLGQQPELFRADWVFCALGTTIRQAGSQAAFRRVDFDYPLQVARLARAQGARRFLLVSAVGASARSRVFYSRVKGELEDAVRALGFESVTFAQPSTLIGDRADVRPGELLALKLSFLTPGAYKPVHDWQVAQGLLRAAHEGRAGVQVLDNISMRREKQREMG